MSGDQDVLPQPAPEPVAAPIDPPAPEPAPEAPPVVAEPPPAVPTATGRVAVDKVVSGPGKVSIVVEVGVDEYTANALDGLEAKLSRSQWADLKAQINQAANAVLGAKFGDRVEGGV